MKKISLLFTVSLLFFVSTTKAQIQRGNLLVGADLANLNLNLNSGGAFSLRLDPKVAFFIKNNLSVGPYVSLDLFSVKNEGPSVNYGVGELGRTTLMILPLIFYVT